MKHEPVKDHAERKRLLALIERCEKEQTMSRYIDADEAEKRLRAGCAYAIRELPSIDIVRCRECKYWVSDGGVLMICDIHKDPTVPAHFCSYGERRNK